MMFGYSMCMKWEDIVVGIFEFYLFDVVKIIFE